MNTISLRRTPWLALALVAAIAGSTAPLAARNLSYEAAVGHQTPVGSHVRFAKGSSDCAPGEIPTMTIIVPPKLGDLSTATAPVTLAHPDFGTSYCVGRSAPGRLVFYTPRAAGVDTFHYQMSSQGLPTTDWFITVHVR